MSRLLLAGAFLALFASFSHAFAPSTHATSRIVTWEREAESNIRSLLGQRANTAANPLMVAVCGIPGSGKSTGADLLGSSLNDVGCLVFPHDGYHYPKSELQQFSDPEAAVYRRGAPDTFDAVALQQDLLRIRAGEEPAVALPGFDHAVGDPFPSVHRFCRNDHQIVICEGLYLLHWPEISDLFDLKIFVDADEDICMERLKIRNTCIPGYSPEEIHVRVDAVDRQNARTVIRSKERADLVYKAPSF